MKPPRPPSSITSLKSKGSIISMRSKKDGSRSSSGKRQTESRDEESSCSEDERTFKTSQYIEVLRQILKDKNVDLHNFEHMSITSKTKSCAPQTNTTNVLPDDDANEEGDQRSFSSNDETQYEYHLELKSKCTDVSSVTDTNYSTLSKHRNSDKNNRGVFLNNENFAANAVTSILSAGGSFDSAVKTMTSIIKDENIIERDKALGDNKENKSVKSTKSSKSRHSNVIKKSSSSSKNESSISRTPLQPMNNPIPHSSSSQANDSVQAWAIVAVSAAASVLGAGGSRTSAQAASAAVLSTGSKTNDQYEGAHVGIAAAAEASAAVLATGSDQASATAAAIAVLSSSQSFASTPLSKINIPISRCNKPEQKIEQHEKENFYSNANKITYHTNQEINSHQININPALEPTLEQEKCHNVRSQDHVQDSLIMKEHLQHCPQHIENPSHTQQMKNKSQSKGKENDITQRSDNCNIEASSQIMSNKNEGRLCSVSDKKAKDKSAFIPDTKKQQSSDRFAFLDKTFTVRGLISAGSNEMASFVKRSFSCISVAPNSPK